MIQLIVIFLFAFTLMYGNTQEINMNEGKEFGKSETRFGLEQANKISVEDFRSLQDNGNNFDSEDAKQRMKNHDIPSSEVRDYVSSDEVLINCKDNRSFDPNEYLFHRSEELAKHPNIINELITEDITEYVEETCLVPDVPFSLNSQLNLVVEVHHKPEIKKDVKICSGHRSKVKHFWKSDAEKEKIKLEKRLKSDPTVKKYNVKISGGGGLSEYVVKCVWNHFDDATSCDAYKKKNKKVKDECWEEQDQWVPQNEETEKLAQSLQCTFIGKECLDNTPSRLINGKSISRQCWVEKWLYKCRYEETKQCELLKNKHCMLIQRKCLQHDSQGCALWEMRFKCASKINSYKHQLNEGEIYGTHNEDWDASYSPNTTFVHIASTMSIFDAIKKELENAQASDASQLQLFKGKDHKCSKSVAEDLMYDCCFSYGGLAKEIKLSHCNTDEVALADMREKGLCHYIGFYEDKFLDLWKSRKEHVFCCFPNKIARVFQEQAREYLEIGWGTPKHPDCRGLTCYEISQLDFSKIDLSEAFEQPPETNNIQERVDSLEKKLKERLAGKELQNV